MTREEIIKGLRDIDTCQPWENEVIEMAIKALEQEPIASPSFSYTATIKADDEQLERLQGILNGEMVIRLEQEPKTQMIDKSNFDVEQYKADLDTAYECGKAEARRTGKWVLLDECANSGYYCSECHKKLVKEGWSNTVKKIKFCPNCGADMRGAE